MKAYGVNWMRWKKSIQSSTSSAIRDSITNDVTLHISAQQPMEYTCPQRMLIDDISRDNIPEELYKICPEVSEYRSYKVSIYTLN